MDQKNKSVPKEIGVIESSSLRAREAASDSLKISLEIDVAVGHINRVCKRIVGRDVGKNENDSSSATPMPSDDCPLIEVFDNSSCIHSTFNREVVGFLEVVRKMLIVLDPAI